jgi:hypothetical protein
VVHNQVGYVQCTFKYVMNTSKNFNVCSVNSEDMFGEDEDEYHLDIHDVVLLLVAFDVWNEQALFTN